MPRSPVGKLAEKGMHEDGECTQRWSIEILMESKPSPEVKAYIERMLGFLDGRAPLTIQAGTAEALEDGVAGLTLDAQRQAEGPGKWSVLQVVQHLADVEWVLGFRYRKLAAEDGTEIPVMSQDDWTKAFGHQASNIGEPLEVFKTLRALNLRFLERLQPSQWQHAGRHPERGLESLEGMVRLYAAHDLCHLAQIRRICEQIGHKRR